MPPVRLLLCVTLAFSARLVGFAQSAPTAEKRDASVEPTSTGHVLGQVYDAATGAPVEGARISIRQDCRYAEGGKTLGKTDSFGQYDCEAMLGRVSSNLDVGRLMNTGVIGLMMGGATNTTRRIDISRVTLKVEREGYRTFEGIVPCRRGDPQSFRVWLEPILLAPASDPHESTVAEGWGVVRIREVTVAPTVLHPGDEALVTVHVESPPLAHARDLKVACTSTLWGLKELSAQDAGGDGSLAFAGKFTVPRSQKPTVAQLTAVITGSPYALAEPGASLSVLFEEPRTARTAEVEATRGEEIRAARLNQSALVQVAGTQEEIAAAARRAEAFRALAAGDNAAAAAQLKEICSGPAGGVWDLEQLADADTALHDLAGAVDALERAASLAPESERLHVTSRYAGALVANGQGQQAVSKCLKPLQDIKEAELPKRVPVALLVALGNGYLQTGQLDFAEKVALMVDMWPNAALDPEVSALRRAVRLARAEAQVKQDPGDSTALAHYGRVLMDAGRWADAITQLQPASHANPIPPGIDRDIAYAELHLAGAAPPSWLPLDAALEDARQQVELPDIHDANKHVDSKEFFAWHAYAVLLYAQARERLHAGDASADALLERSRAAFRQALRCGRGGAAVNNGQMSLLFGYTSGRVVAISGFAYPEASSDFVVLDALSTMSRQQPDALTLLALGSALLELGMPRLAAEPLRQALEIQPGLVEAKYAQALVSVQTGDHAAAEALLRVVLEANPRHPHANLALARLYAAEGDISSAAACMAAHARYYGAAR